MRRACLLACLLVAAGAPARAADPALRAAAAIADITPELGSPIVGGFHPVPATHVHDPLHARCLVLDDGTRRLALVVCDLLGLHRSVGDEARRLVQERTGIPPDCVLVCATHTHSAASALGERGLEAFPAVQDPLEPYQSLVAQRIAEAVQRATAALRPAELACGTVDVPEHLFNRRWFMRPGTMPENPFGTATDLVKMNPPAGSPGLVGQAGPVDPTLSFLAVREPAGVPIAVFAAYSLHYVGGVESGRISADYFALVADELARLLGAEGRDPAFVAMLANGTSGDVNNHDYRAVLPKRKPYEQMGVVARDVAGRIHRGLAGLEYRTDVSLDAVYREVEIPTRRPTADELAWAHRTLERRSPAGGRPSLAEIYAVRVLGLEGQPPVLRLPLQLLRIGAACIGTLPCETFTEIGLEFRKRCDARPAFIVSLAHGYYGYLPTPRQLDLGGYETWPGTNRLGREAATTMLDALVDMARVAATREGPPAPERARRAMHVDPGLSVEVAAAEPEVVDPVAVAFDEDGRLWVAEMGDYPTGPPAGARPLSRIKRLEDRDGDGRYEHAVVFADGLSFCTGLQPWRGGVIVTLAGAVAFLADTDGDGRADRHETWFTGFAEDNTQLRANHPRLGPDGLVYVANGLRGGAVRAADPRWVRAGDSLEPLPLAGRDFRFDPRGGGFDAVSGHGQFGLTFDDWGTRFVCSNRHPCRQVILEDHDVRRNPSFAVADVVHDVVPAATAIHPLSRGWTTSPLHAGQFTAACGVTVFRGDGLPPEYAGDVFTCDPTGNLVHRTMPRGDGVALAAADGPTREFLASGDEWFRPVSLATGPDGCLYVVDMCRGVIEHPDFMPDEMRTAADLRAGDDRGRIYRVTASARRSRPAPRLSTATTAELVACLEHANGWHRDTAARLLVERADATAVAPLTRMAQSGRPPAARVLALKLLAGLGLLPDATIRTAIDDAHPRMRQAAISLSGQRLAADAELRRRVVDAARDPDPRVRFEAALRLGDIPAGSLTAAEAKAVSKALADAALAAADDPWTRAAVATSAAGRAGGMLAAVLEALPEPATRPETILLVARFAELLGGPAERHAIDGVLVRLDTATDAVAFAVVGGLGRGLDRHHAVVTTLRPAWTDAAGRSLERVADRARRATDDAAADPALRLAAVPVLRHLGTPADHSRLLDLAAAEPDPTVRVAAIAEAARLTTGEFADRLLGGLARQTPAIRRAILDGACGVAGSRLLDLVASGEIKPALLDPGHWQRLVRHRDAGVRERAAALRDAGGEADRRAVIAAYRPAIDRAGDPHRGRDVFARACAACHRVADLGSHVGPDISDSRTKRPEQYLVDVLDPNRAVDAAFLAHTLLLADGRSVTGIVVTETGGTVTVRQPDGTTTSLLRGEIESCESSGTSLMPVGFERSISVEEMADLIAFLKRWRDGRPSAAAAPN